MLNPPVRAKAKGQRQMLSSWAGPQTQKESDDQESFDPKPVTYGPHCKEDFGEELLT